MNKIQRIILIFSAEIHETLNVICKDYFIAQTNVLGAQCVQSIKKAQTRALFDKETKKIV